jgi:hypothetical protein
MSEENQQQPQPVSDQSVIPDPIPPQAPVEDPKLHGNWKGRRGALEGLPKEVKEDMESYMRKENPHATWRYMAEKYGEQFPVLKEISRVAFNQYWKRHKVEIARELILQKRAAEIDPEIRDVIDKITDPDVPLQDKRNALTALYSSCEARSKLLQERQTNFIDPQLEALILANTKEQHNILKTVATLNDQLTKESDKDWLGEAVVLTQVILSSVYNSYRLTHPDQSNFSMFSSTLSENIQAVLKNYKSEKEKLKKEPAK